MEATQLGALLLMDCLFCNIIESQIESNLLYQDQDIVIIDDIQPQAPVHKLIIPRKHIATLNDLTPIDSNLVSQILFSAIDMAKQLNIADNGYRLVWNCNHQGGQAVFHIHLHLLGGRQMLWPPG